MSTDAPDSHKEPTSHSTHGHPHGAEGGAAHEHHHEVDEPLHDPDLHAVSSYGHSDPASIAALPSLDLHNPDLGPEVQPSPPLPALSVPVPVPDLAPLVVEAAPPSTPIEGQPPRFDSLLAHLTQVGLIDTDTWEEQMKPRIDQLHVDIKDVHVQLDGLEMAHRKTKKS
jgi:hypothetical protein